MQTLSVPSDGGTMELSPPHEKVVELMRIFIQARYWKMELIMLNQCRLYLRVMYLSDKNRTIHMESAHNC